MKGWFAETGRPAYVCGPLLPSASKTIAMMYEMDESDSSDEVKWFLDATLARSGEKSLLYVSCPTALTKRGIARFSDAASVTIDIVRFSLLAGDESGNTVGRSRRYHGAQHTFREYNTLLHSCSVAADAHRAKQILSYGSPLAVIPDDMKAKVEAYGRGLLTPWTPQQLVLDHPVSSLAALAARCSE